MWREGSGQRRDRESGVGEVGKDRGKERGKKEKGRMKMGDSSGEEGEWDVYG